MNEVEHVRTKQNGGFVRSGLVGSTGLKLGSFGAGALDEIGAKGGGDFNRPRGRPDIRDYKEL
jgi:hypothetical protein